MNGKWEDWPRCDCTDPEGDPAPVLLADPIEQAIAHFRPPVDELEEARKEEEWRRKHMPESRREDK